MATTSQKMIEIKFLVRIRGARTPPPTIEEPVMKIPLNAETPPSARLFVLHVSDKESEVVFVPCCPYDRETNAERDTQACPSDGGYRFEKGADLAKQFVRSSIPLLVGRRHVMASQEPLDRHTLKASPLPVKSISVERD